MTEEQILKRKLEDTEFKLEVAVAHLKHIARQHRSLNVYTEAGEVKYPAHALVHYKNSVKKAVTCADSCLVKIGVSYKGGKKK